MSTESTKDLFRVHRSIWKFAGLIRPSKKHIAYYCWIVILNGCLTFFYPLHMIMGLLEASNKTAIFQNLSTVFVDVQISIKHILFWWNLEKIRHIENLFTTLDKSIRTKDEQRYYRKIATRSKCILNITGVVYFITGITALGSTFVGEEKRLIFSAWMPIDWRTSLASYFIANTYQFVGVSVQILINFANDTYPPLSLVAVSGHTRLLAMRVSKLAADSNKGHQANNEELRACIRDHKRLIDIHRRLNQVLSVPMFFQILLTGLNLCFSIVYLGFYADNVFAILFYVFLLVALPWEIFPSCYFGSVFEAELDGLKRALYSCNWVDQDREFKQNMLIFSQSISRTSPFICMGIFRIHLDSFFYAMKSAYSLLAVCLQTK